MNTAKAKQALLGLAGKVNSRGEASEKVGDTIKELSDVLGIDVEGSTTDREEELADMLVEIRDNAREREDYETSDFIRDQLKSLGFEIEDTNTGSEWF